MERADNITCPDDFDPEDVEFIRHLVPDGAMVTDFVVVVSWMDTDGDLKWKPYVPTSVTARTVGLLEIAKSQFVFDVNPGMRGEMDDDDD